MSCHFSEKVSLLIDSELEPKEVAQVEAHLAACPACRQEREELLAIRRQVRSYSAAPDPMLQRRALWKILSSENRPLWKRTVTLPAPALAFALVAVLALAAWAAFSIGARPRAISRQVKVEPAESRDAQANQGMDLSRYDRGERAVIYKTARRQPRAIER
jgi:anti-sigma factor RsiW